MLHLNVETDNPSILGIVILHSNNTSVGSTVVKNTKNAVCSDVVGAIVDLCFTTDILGIMIGMSNSTVIANTSIQSGMLILQSEHTSLQHTSVNLTAKMLIFFSNNTKFLNSYVIIT